MLIRGDCVEVMAGLPESSVDAVVCDPPYGLEFMGKDWDSMGHGSGQQAWHYRWAVEALRVLKPGGHLLAFGGSRTYHRMASAVEDARFEIRDQIMWLYGQGFPKSLNVGKAIDKAAGAEPIDLGESPNWRESKRDREKDGRMEVRGEGAGRLTAPATPEAAQWDGWGTALKPAHEPIVVARKPLSGTVAANVLEWGTGALNIDGCRISCDECHGEGIEVFSGAPGAEVSRVVACEKCGVDPGAVHRQGAANPLYVGGAKPGDIVAMYKPAGRWPANVVLDEEAAAILDEQSGQSTSRRGNPRGTAKKGLFANSEFNKVGTEHDDSGGASRFFAVFRTTHEACMMCGCEIANTAANPSGPPSPNGDSAQRPAATAEHPEDQPSNALREPSTSATPNASGQNDGNATPLTLFTGERFSPESPPTRPTEGSPASPAERSAPTVTTTTTGSPSLCAGCAARATSSTTPPNLEPGVADLLTGPRFTYCAKASTAERNAVLEALPDIATRGNYGDGIQDNRPHTKDGYEYHAITKNNHPTVKPIALMRWLVRLVTPPGGTVLDPFTGSGTTGIAAHLEGFQFIGIEQNPEYVAIAEARIAWWTAQPSIEWVP